MNEITIKAPEGQEIKLVDNVITFVAKEKKLPTSIDELGESNYSSGLVPLHKSVALENFIQLIRFRNAWNECWKPDWDFDNIKFTIVARRGKIHKTQSRNVNSVMHFKTESIRDKFFDTFKDLLETAKDFL